MMDTIREASPRTRSPGEEGRPSRRSSQWLPFRPGRSRSRQSTETLVIIGNGPASFRLCEKLVGTVPPPFKRIVVFGEEPTPAYDRVRLTQLFEEGPPDRLLFAPRAWYSEHGIELHTGDPVTAVDLDHRLVRSASGKEVHFDKLVFATGSKAFLPPIEGTQLEGVFVYRSQEDLARIRAHSTGRSRAVILGGGLLGLEISAALRKLDLQTWVVERGITLLARHLDPAAGSLLRQQVERLGIHVICHRETERIVRLDDELLLEFTNGECLKAHLVIVTAGVRPRDELAAACGLRRGKHGGIAVDDQLQTSHPGVFAIGECASHRDTIYGLAGPTLAMAETVADVLRGQPHKFTGADTSAWLKVPGISVAALGDFQANAQGTTVRTADCYRQLMFSGSRIIGATSVGDWPEQYRVHSTILQNGRISRWQRARFQRTGRLWRTAPPKRVSDWSPDAIVCNCRAVRRGTLSQAQEQGCRTIDQLACATGASTVCGSCKPLLADLLGTQMVAQPVRGARTLLAASALALAAMAWIAFGRPLSISDSAQTPSPFQFLWIESEWRQATGFTALALIIAGIAFSARKRVARFRFGSAGGWRAFHAVLGALTLVALVTHTGLRLGYNLNLVLMLNVLLLSAAGSMTGFINSLERRFSGPTGRRIRAAWTATHLLFAWPLPVLILFHVFSAYYF